jgi:hypothetical protein
MANEFGNAGALSAHKFNTEGVFKGIRYGTESQFKLAAKTVDIFNNGSQWEVFYGGYWRDIASNFSWDTTQEGNTILRAIRADDGHRSYRADRGLILQQKKQEEKDVDDLLSFGSDFTRAFGTSMAVSLGVNIIKETFNINPMGVVLGSSLAIAGYSFGQDLSLQSATINFAKTALSFALLTAIPKKYGAFAIPVLSVLSGIIKGEKASSIIGSLAGNLAGGYLSPKVSSKINEQVKPLITQQNLPAKVQSIKDQLGIVKGKLTAKEQELAALKSMMTPKHKQKLNYGFNINIKDTTKAPLSSIIGKTSSSNTFMKTHGYLNFNK